MSYFSRFPLVRYQGNLLVNLTRRTGIPDSIKNDPAYYYEYTVDDSDTPEIVADKLYDDANLAWVILQFNDIVNVFEEWPMSQYALDQYINNKYVNPHSIHHYLSLTTGARVFPDTHPSYDRKPVTCYEHEVNINDDKRKIKLVLPNLVGTIVKRHKEIIQKGI